MCKINNQEKITYDIEWYVDKARKVHGDKYDYSKAKYVTVKTPMIIGCPIHGYSKQHPESHLNGIGCSKCAEEKNKNIFILQSKNLYGDKYDYSSIKYINQTTEVDIICKLHGKFKILPKNLLRGYGCKTCHNNNISLKKGNEFIQKSIKKHGNKYDYSKVVFKDVNTPVIIICRQHGEFLQEPHIHKMGCGCPKCVGKNRTTEDFVNQASKVHENKYDYSKTEYKGIFSKIIIICKQHGEFLQTPNCHLNSKTGCPKCTGRYRTFEEFLKKAKEVHGDKYDYSKVDINNIKSESKIEIICKEHGSFFKLVGHHLHKYGCPHCTKSYGEKSIKNFLIKNKINYIPQKKFDNCVLKKQLSFDFYLPDYNTCIEYDGVQHFKPVKRFGGKKFFKLQKERDNVKTNYCEQNNIKLIRIPYNKNITEILTCKLNVK